MVWWLLASQLHSMILRLSSKQNDSIILFLFSTRKRRVYRFSKHTALRRKDHALLEGQVNMSITRSFAKDPEFSPAWGQNDTFHQKVSEIAPVKLSRCNFFCSNQTLLVISYPNQNNTDKNNLLTDDTFFLKNCLFNALPLPLSLHWNSDWHQKAAVLHAPCRSTTTAPEPASLPLKSWNLIRMLKIALWILQTINN